MDEEKSDKQMDVDTGSRLNKSSDLISLPSGSFPEQTRAHDPVVHLARARHLQPATGLSV